ncbi:hypothetical protein EVAR_33438_1 [Eumeta japonica]|uniref:Uncharacterized protein n=1 Tax=Eumeta variegata TaxID=151549 RepID=A0A4C1W3D1_EUMVA|nr:hypothetical protein EVAR_33438_1 [Eumeta japonica]
MSRSKQVGECGRKYNRSLAGLFAYFVESSNRSILYSEFVSVVTYSPSVVPQPSFSSSPLHQPTIYHQISYSYSRGRQRTDDFSGVASITGGDDHLHSGVLCAHISLDNAINTSEFSSLTSAIVTSAMNVTVLR